MEQTEDRECRVSDYLDDKLQTLGDLDSLQSLLSNIRNQHGLLKKQLEDAGKDLQEAKKASQSHQASLQEQARQFSREQDDIDGRLKIITGSKTSDEAVPRFESSMDKLRRLDVANGYVELLKGVDVLSKEAQSQLRKPNGDALGPYRKLQTLVIRMLPLHDAAEEAAPHLLDHVSKTTQNLRREIKDAFSADLEVILKKIQWPNPKAVVPATLRDEWDTCVGKLLDLQMPELEAMESNSGRNAAAMEGNLGRSAPSKGPAVLFPFEVLVEPLEMRFRYHFEGDKPTNRLDKPEYFLSHITTLLDDYNAFMLDYLQPVLLSRFRGTDLAFNPIYIDATSALITALLPMLRTKIFTILPQLAGQPQLLSHTMHEIMGFDTSIRDDWRYDGGEGIEGWKGLAWEVLVQKDLFGRWLQVEKDFALARYQNIISAPDNGDLDYDSVDPGSTKPTKGAIRVNDLLETITDRYRPLTSFSQKLRFLIDIQLSIFDKFHERLHSGLEAYLSMTSSIGRTVQGISKEEQAKLQGVDGLERLCRINGSADYLEKAMRDWSDDLFFLELWEELQDRARGHPIEPLAGPMTIADVAERTSSTVGSDVDTGALFDETAGAYSRLRIRSEAIIIDVLSNNVRKTLRPYIRANPWAALTSPSSTNSSPSAELDPLLTYLDTALHFLSRALSAAPFRRITRNILHAISTVLWDGVLTRYHFSTAGAAQLAADLRAICRVVDASAGAGVAEVGIRKPIEAARLIGVPVKGTRARVQSRSQLPNPEPVEEEWEGGDAWDDDDEVAVEVEDSSSKVGRAGEADRGDGTGLGLWEVDRRLFDSNQSARDVLEEMGLEVLTENEARSLMRLRVELGS
ncbi:hypothetical protein K432DRAFT_378152 [Lepidopterella palustris CBS 459.81]|uniref:RINT-1 family protein n=1 Tax=Lepidopterella palustris CBS 459.81 TaxID=1314670 RepID=A0A8E2EJH2_9PEZI|nr:hypothetical protein K432DRAFT_378152 [Lepidopterella palustris CBS 459.81]